MLNNDIGTKCFLAPEMWDDKPFKGRPVDIWAMGISLYMLNFGEPPFNSKNVS